MKKIYTCSLIIMSLCLFIACTSDNDDEGDKERTSQNNGGNNNNNNPTPQKPSKIKKICVGTISEQSAYGAYSFVFNENGSLTNCYNNGKGNGSVRLKKYVRTVSF